MLASQLQVSYSCTKMHTHASIHTWHFLITLFVLCNNGNYSYIILAG